MAGLESVSANHACVNDGRCSDFVMLDKGYSSLKLETVLIGTLISVKEINKGALINVLKLAWAGMGEIQISNILKNKFMFTFKERTGAEKVMKNAPWTINGSWLALTEWLPNQTLDEVDTDFVVCWVQIHGLPLGMMTESNGRALGGRIGKVLEAESPKFAVGGYKSFLRVRIEMDYKIPLIKGAWAQKPDGNIIWVDFRYERLGDFCYKCGCLDHINKGCKMGVPEDQGKFGPGLRANQVRRNSAVINQSDQKENLAKENYNEKNNTEEMESRRSELNRGVSDRGFSNPGKGVIGSQDCYDNSNNEMEQLNQYNQEVRSNVDCILKMAGSCLDNADVSNNKKEFVFEGIAGSTKVQEGKLMVRDSSFSQDYIGRNLDVGLETNKIETIRTIYSENTASTQHESFVMHKTDTKLEDASKGSGVTT